MLVQWPLDSAEQDLVTFKSNFFGRVRKKESGVRVKDAAPATALHPGPGAPSHSCLRPPHFTGRGLNGAVTHPSPCPSALPCSEPWRGNVADQGGPDPPRQETRALHGSCWREHNQA